jgi:hypothetical protein
MGCCKLLYDPNAVDDNVRTNTRKRVGERLGVLGADPGDDPLAFTEQRGGRTTQCAVGLELSAEDLPGLVTKHP